MTSFERGALPGDLQLTLRQIPAGTPRAMPKPRLPHDPVAGEIAAGLGLPGAMRVGVSAARAATDPPTV